MCKKGASRGPQELPWDPLARGLGGASQEKVAFELGLAVQLEFGQTRRELVFLQKPNIFGITENFLLPDHFYSFLKCFLVPLSQMPLQRTEKYEVLTRHQDIKMCRLSYIISA